MTDKAKVPDKGTVLLSAFLKKRTIEPSLCPEFVRSKKEAFKMAKKQRDAGKIFVKIMAGVLAGLMILGVAGTLIYYITL